MKKRILPILGTLLFAYLTYVVLSFISAVGERIDEQGNEEALIIHRAENGSIINCYETYRKDFIQNDTNFVIRHRIRVPVENTELYMVNTYTEGYSQYHLDGCFNNKIVTNNH